jgi:hypothetical protein
MILLQVLQRILTKVNELEIGELTEQTWTRLTFERVSPLESADTDDEVFRRRMGMRTYFKELKMSMTRI